MAAPALTPIEQLLAIALDGETPGEAQAPIDLADPYRLHGDTAVLGVDRDSRPCPFCLLAIDGHAAIAILETGELRWAHPVCAVQANGGVSAMRPKVAA